MTVQTQEAVGSRAGCVRWQAWGWPLAILAVGAWAYHNSFSGPFIFDDLDAITSNRRLRHLWPLWQMFVDVPFQMRGRPILTLSFALNYALSGFQVWSYHAVNLAIHLLAALTVYGIIRRTLQVPRLHERYAAAASSLAGAVAVLWVAHPLNTQSVTYIMQRTESLMGLCYLLTLYCFLRSLTDSHPRWWYVAGGLACAAGMGSKPAMVTAPLMMWCFDRIFVSGSFRQAWRKRRGWYLGLAATWLIGVLWFREAASPVKSHVVWWQYALTQPGVFVHYLRLAIWPHPLVLDYGWPWATTISAVAVPGAIVAALMLVLVWALRRAPALGFLGVWVVGILAPSTSLLPVADVAEQRMYVPLIGVVALCVIVGWAWLRQVLPVVAWRRGLAGVVVVVLTGTYGRLTIHRNMDYQTEERIWRDTVAKRPRNSRAQNNLGVVLADKKQLDEAFAHLEEAVRLKPDSAEAHNNFGALLVNRGRVEEALVHYHKALALRPDYADAYHNVGAALVVQGHLAEAAPQYAKAMDLAPDDPTYRHSYAVVASATGKIGEAIMQERRALVLSPGYLDAHQHLALLLLQQDDAAEAIPHFEAVLQAMPNDGQLRSLYAVALERQGRTEQALAQCFQALPFLSDDPALQQHIGDLLANQGRLDEAALYYQAALSQLPNAPELHHNFAVVLEGQGRADDAIAQETEALRLRPDYSKAHQHLAELLTRQGRTAEAKQHLKAVDGARPAKP